MNKKGEIKIEEKYTYSDWLTWDDESQYEIIDGTPYKTIAPNRKHQSASLELSRQIGNFLLDKKCKVYCAPFVIRFPEGINDKNKIIDVVQPDISVICNPSILDDEGCQGAPDFIIEILSISMLGDNGKYIFQAQGQGQSQVIEVKNIPGLFIDFTRIFKS